MRCSRQHSRSFISLSVATTYCGISLIATGNNTFAADKHINVVIDLQKIRNGRCSSQANS